MKSIVLGGGCFWCLEAAYQQVEGVQSVVPGYAGGHTVNPSYEDVCSGHTGHAEVVRLTYDEAVLPLREVLSIFFVIHDPTSLNRQGADVGTEYRSLINYESSEDQEVISDFMTEASTQLSDPIVTEVAMLEHFYEAEDYHHNYFENHPEQAYCQAVIEPKLAKLRNYLSSRP